MPSPAILVHPVNLHTLSSHAHTRLGFNRCVDLYASGSALEALRPAPVTTMSFPSHRGARTTSFFFSFIFAQERMTTRGRGRKQRRDLQGDPRNQKKGPGQVWRSINNLPPRELLGIFLSTLFESSTPSSISHAIIRVFPSPSPSRFFLRS